MPNGEKESKGGECGIIFLPSRFACQLHEEVSSSSTHKELMHQENRQRWLAYFVMQNQYLKMMTDDRELKNYAEECEIMATDTTNMSPNRKAWLANEHDVHHGEEAFEFGLQVCHRLFKKVWSQRLICFEGTQLSFYALSNYSVKSCFVPIFYQIKTLFSFCNMFLILT